MHKVGRRQQSPLIHTNSRRYLLSFITSFASANLTPNQQSSMKFQLASLQALLLCGVVVSREDRISAAPSFSPTPSPTAAPSDLPTDFPFEPRPPGPQIEYPFYRFRLWADLTNTIRTAAEGLGYNQATWENPGTESVEGSAWWALSEERKELAGTIGFEEFVWDCYVNHYDDYFWDELIEAEVVQYYEVLGWTEELWNDELGTVPAEQLFYRQLSQEEQAAADAICYFEDLWNETPLSDWDELPDTPLTEAPTAPPTATESLTPTVSPTPEITISPAPSAVPSANPTASGPTLDPSAAPSSMPAITDSPTVTPTTPFPSATPTTGAPSAPPTVDIRKPPVDEIDYPDFRYELWEDLDVETKILAEELSWTETTWDNPGTADVEDFAYGDLPDDSQSDAQSMGFDEMSWNCYINHFNAFLWNALEELDVQKYFVELGWTRESWEGEFDPPPTEGARWIDLTADEQEAARELCYTEELWESTPLADWPRDPGTDDDDSASTQTLLSSTMIGLLLLWTL